MKRFMILFFVCLALSGQIVHSQLLTFDAALDALLTSSNLQQAIYFGQQVADNATQIQQFATQVEYTIKSYEESFNNLSRIGDVRSYDDFMSWYNRQLYLERRATETFENMHVSIGNKNYAFYDIAGMANGIDETFVQYWNNEFTEEQRREMWLGLGLSPANYAYRAVWQEKEMALARRFLTLSDIQNEDYVKNVSNSFNFFSRAKRAALFSILR